MNAFNITYKNLTPKEQKLREALCTLGNGYFATRGAAEESSADEFNYPGTYLAAGFNRAKTEVAGREIENEDFVNFPNWLCLSFKPEDGEWLSLEHFEVLEYQQTLQMKEGVLAREFRVKDKQGKITKIESQRVVSMHEKHAAGIAWTFTPENWSGRTAFRSGLDGTVINHNVERYKDLESHHLNPLQVGQIDEKSIWLEVETRQSRIVMAQAARTQIYKEDQLLKPAVETNTKEGYIDQIFEIEVEKGQKYEIEKVVALYTSRDQAISEPVLEAKKDVQRAKRFQKILLPHQAAMRRLWIRADIDILDKNETQGLLRLHIFHVLQTVSFNTIGLSVGVPSRGLHGEAYRGHIFWDELYIFPFLNLRFPEISRSLLMYRYERLDEARYAAKEEGYRGAMFPWQSGSNGREESQVVHLNPKSGNWIPDNTYLQRHVNCAIAFNIWNYYLATDDEQFLSTFGAEMFLSIASFWGSKVTFNKERSRYEIHGVVGPDEYHTSYPNSDEKGLKNNAYTNVLVAWLLHKALEILDLLEQTRKKELLDLLEIDEAELKLWDAISKKMFIPLIDDDIIEQFEGYHQLKEFPWEEYKEKYDDIQRLDRVLESENDSPNNYQANKQADVLMLFYLFNEAELRGIFNRMGYHFHTDMIGKNISYYKKRTSHGSTLSRLVFSWILNKYDRSVSWENFQALLVSDFKDIQGGTTLEGIHLGAMAGSLNLVQRCYAGLETCDDALWIKPNLPLNIKEISIRLKYKNHWIRMNVNSEKIIISFEEGWSEKVKIGVIDEIYEFQKGVKREFSIKEHSEQR
ncbi:MAG: glycosyl hydrolase family 65 protein [Cyclobacteriaceae bacterium]